MHPLPTTVVRGDPVTLDCRVDDDADDAVVEWYRDGRPVDIDPSVSTDKFLNSLQGDPILWSYTWVR